MLDEENQEGLWRRLVLIVKLGSELIFVFAWHPVIVPLVILHKLALDRFLIEHLISEAVDNILLSLSMVMEVELNLFSESVGLHIMIL